MKERDDEVTQKADELREHYSFDYSKAKPNRFARRFNEESIAVILDPDVAAVFTTSETANQALRAMITALGNLVEKPELAEKARNSAAAVAFSQSRH